MFKKSTSVILSVIFLLFIAAPTLITMVDDSVDVSVVFSTSEEKEKGFEFILLNVKANASDLVSNYIENNLGYYFKKYPKPNLNFISPPPEQVCLI